MNEYLKQYIELKKQFIAANEGPDSVRALYASTVESAWSGWIVIKEEILWDTM